MRSVRLDRAHLIYLRDCLRTIDASLVFFGLGDCSIPGLVGYFTREGFPTLQKAIAVIDESEARAPTSPPGFFRDRLGALNGVLERLFGWSPGSPVAPLSLLHEVRAFIRRAEAVIRSADENALEALAELRREACRLDSRLCALLPVATKASRLRYYGCDAGSAIEPRRPTGVVR